MTLEPAREIEARSRAIVQAALQAPALAGHLRQVKALTGDTAREYAGRFLIELVQNGYDAQPVGSSTGRLAIRLDRDEGAFGVVYVANTGRPFSMDDVIAISELAQSTKQPGEGIGHKGLGFKSVLQASRWPEIYSAREPMGAESITNENGYCFRFALPGDIRALAGNADELAVARVEHDLSPYALPIPIVDVPDAVVEYRRDGFTTVIRLPLNSEEALAAAAEQVAALRDDTVPIQLFLDRVSEILIAEDGNGGLTRLTRAARPLSSGSALRLEVVDLAGQGQYLVASDVVDPERRDRAIGESVDHNRADESWRHWNGEARVSLAVSLNQREVGRLYTFLPMGGDVTAPLAAHVNAPFITRVARDHLDRSVALNRALLDVAGEVAAAAASALPSLGTEWGPRVVVDLLSWTDADVSRLHAGFHLLGTALPQASVVPVVGERKMLHWAPATGARIWVDDGRRVLTSTVLRQASGMPFVDATLGPERLASLRDVMGSVEVALDPEAEELAAWVEQVAAHAARRRFNRRWWEDFYADLAECFGRDGESLHGRRILIDSDGHLRPGGILRAGRRRVAAVFFSPRNLLVDEADETIDDDVDVTVPASLRNHVAFMHPELRWQEMDQAAGRMVRRTSHKFLEDSRLVTRFRRGTVLQHLVEVLRASRDKRLHGEALRFVFNLQKGKLPQRPTLDEMAFRVPTASGALVPATEAVFSAAWPGTYGQEMEGLIAQAGPVSSAIASIGERLLVPPHTWPFEFSAAGAWREFLRGAGVRDGLWPTPTGPESLRDNGDELHPSKLSARFDLAEPTAAMWRAAAATTGARARHPWTSYDLQGRVWVLPGQDDYANFSSATRVRFATAIIHGLGNWTNDALTTRFRRPRAEREADPFEWPSPAAAFLQRAEWLPISRPGQPGTFDFARPAAAWHYAQSDRDPLPQFAPLVATHVRRQLDQVPAAESRLRRFGLHLWSDASDAVARLRWMGALFADVAPTLAGNFRKAYERTWELLVEGAVQDADPLGDQQIRLVVSRRSQLETVELPAALPQVIYVPDHEDKLSDLLFRSMDVPVMQIDPDEGQAAIQLLAPIAGEATFHLTSEASLQVVADGSPVIVSEELGDLIVAAHPWLTDVFALTLELRATQFNRQSEHTVAQALAHLARVRVVSAQAVGIRLESAVQPPPPYFRGAIPIEDADHPTIVLEGDAPDLGWEELIRLTPAIAEILGEPLMASPLELALVELRRLGEDRPYAPTSGELAAAFREPVERIEEIRKTRRGSVEHVIELLRPVAAHFAGIETVGVLSPEIDLASVSDVIAALGPLGSRMPRPIEELVASAHEAPDLWTLRRRLGIPFGAFNETLIALGMTPLTDENGHAAAMAAFRQEHREHILGCLRLAYQGSESLEPYVAARQAIATIEPSAAWLPLYELPPSEVMSQVIDSWLGRHGAGPLAMWTGQLPPIDDLRRENRQRVQQVASRLQQLVVAWTSREGTTPPSWATTDGPSLLIELLDRSGMLDFEPVSEENLPPLVRDAGGWPDGMQPSLAPEAHGLTVADLEAQASQAARDQWRRQEERTSIRLDGRLITATDAGLTEIAERVLESSAATVARSPNAEPDMKPVSARRGRKRKPTGGGGGSGVGPRERLTDAQRTAIGLVGETAAFQWLRHHFSATPDAWVSTNRRFVFSDHPGDDGLGYDFQVPRGRALHFFEVKATQGERYEIELSEGELEVARQNARTNRYHILFVPNALDAETRRVVLLPNPLHQAARDVYAWVGVGMRYRFDLE